ncbi:hypothetical protein JOF53_001277 [Crossiella equi]|uniref:Aminoglycoside phosphotransferase domain-containing protein n=1 Tax=Crossiella equi TaxID=130796 RepID=A0ABS5A9I6_9PSEU|nr:phosphotransferase [Crossiella equi]MBP2472405.1 hypothetical protein [Crossiella equi]
MIERRDWAELPAPVRAAIEEQCGAVTAVEQASAGINSAFAATLHTEAGPVFCKATTDSTSPMHLTELQVAPFLPPAAPRLLWHTEVAGWLLLGFEHIAGQHADLSPGSSDLGPVLEAVGSFADLLTPCPPVGVPSLVSKLAWVAAWRRLRKSPPPELHPWVRAHLDDGVQFEAAALEAIQGDTLVHTDLHPLNLLITEDRARVIDWAWAQQAAPWVDPAYLVLRFIADGHTPASAEELVAALPAWGMARDEEVTAFAVAVCGWWEYLRLQHPAPHRAHLAETARRWARHRLASAG